MMIQAPPSSWKVANPCIPEYQYLSAKAPADAISSSTCNARTTQSDDVVIAVVNPSVAVVVGNVRLVGFVSV